MDKPSKGARSTIFNFERNLREVFGYSDFKKIEVYSDPQDSYETQTISQLDVLNRIAAEVEKRINKQNFKDIFFVASTGSGKSLLFQLPALDLHKLGYVTIVVTPLKALMKDQVENLRARGIDIATYVNSDNTYLEREERLSGIKEGRYSLIYVSPEFLVQYSDLSYLIGQKRQVGLYVIDEAHCVSTWGKNFRPDYWFIGKRIKEWRSKDWSEESGTKAPVLALTATSVYGGDFDSLSEIREVLSLDAPEPIIASVRRKNIRIVVNHYNPELRYSDTAKAKFVVGQLRQLTSRYKKIIVYHPFRGKARELNELLKQDGVNSTVFVGDMDKEEREEAYNLLKAGRVSCIVATKAFGMGVNIDDIDCVYHYAINKSLTDYIQEIGRAGRNPSVDALALTHYHDKDLKFTKILNNASSLRQWQLKRVIEKLLYIYRETHGIAKGKWVIVSPDSFASIFSEQEEDLAQKVKTALLLIEKDFFDQLGYPLVSFTVPKSYTVYCAVPDAKSWEVIYEKKLQTCFTKTAVAERTIIRPGVRQLETRREDIYTLDLERLWAMHCKNENLASLRFKFFRGTKLVQGVTLEPRCHVQARLKHDYKTTKEQLYSFISKLEEVMKDFRSSYFTKEELNDALKRKRIQHRNLADLLLTFFRTGGNDELAWTDADCFFIAIRDNGNGGLKQYRVVTNKLPRFKDFMMGMMRDTFLGKSEIDTYLPINKKELPVFLGFLELIELADFQLNAGEGTAYNVYIADPIKLQSEIRGKYRNKLLSGVWKRQNNELLLLQKFATEYKDSESAWDFIEDYLLGRFSYEDTEQEEED